MQFLPSPDPAEPRQATMELLPGHHTKLPLDCTAGASRRAGRHNTKCHAEEPFQVLHLCTSELNTHPNYHLNGIRGKKTVIAYF